MAEYTTKEAVENYLQSDIDSSLDAQITAYIEAMSEHIDEQAGYPVFTDTPTTRTYDGNGRRSLSIDPVHTITEITVDGTAVVPTQAPYNTDIKTELRFELDYFPTATANVTVTGHHCLHKTLKERVAWACTVLVGGIMQQLKEQREGVKSEKIGEYTVTYDEAQRRDYQLAKEIIAKLKPLSF